MITEERLIEMLRTNVKIDSQKDVASRLGISPQYLNHILHHRRSIGKKVSGALGLKRIVMYSEANKE